MAELMHEIAQQPEVFAELLEQYQNGCEMSGPQNANLYLFGTGASLSACMQAKYAFLKYAGRNVTVAPACEAELYEPVLGGNSTAVVVSQSGESYETKVICDLLRRNGVAFTAVTNNPDSYLGKKAAVCCCLHAGTEIGTSTKTQTASTLALYLMALADRREAMAALKELPGAVRETIARAAGYAPELSAWMGEAHNVYLLGLDEAAPTALQGSLMLKEKVRMHCEGVALAEFRHGPVEVLQRGTPVLLTGDRTETERLLCHADFLERVCAAKIALVTNNAEETIKGYRNFTYRWDADKVLGHICATVPFQILAYQMAAERNYDIDGFQYIGKILDQYEKAYR